MAPRAPINGETLRWAMEAVGVGFDELARAVSVRAETVELWAQGRDSPTMRQLFLLADKLDRTPAFFFTPAPVESGAPALVDFRGRSQGELPSAVLREIRRAEDHRAALIQLLGKAETPLVLQDFAPLDVEMAAARMLKDLAGEQDLPFGKAAPETFNNIRALLEHRGVLVFQTTRIPLAAFRGLSLVHDLWPIIIVNGADAANGKVFTLFHELGHLSNRTSGVCLEVDDGAEEALANAFAAEVLMPRERVRQFIQEHGFATPAALARGFHVSEYAAAIRLRVLGRLSPEQLEDAREKAQADWERNRQSMAEKDGFVPSWQLRYRDLGPTYVGAVFEALNRGQIDHLDAAYMMNTRLPTVERMLAEHSRRGA